MGKDAVTVRGGYHLAIEDVSNRMCFKACGSVTALRWRGSQVSWGDLSGAGSRKHSFIPRAVVWKILYDDGVPIKSIARYFGRSRTGIQSGISRLTKDMDLDQEAINLYEQAKNGYYA